VILRLSRYPGVWIIALGLALAACSGNQQGEQSPDQTGIPATVMTIAADEMPEVYVTTGTVSSENRVDIASRVMGFIRSIKVHEGQDVKKGQLLVRIDSEDIRAHLREAQAALAQAKARAVEAKADYERYSALHAQQAVTEREFQQITLKNQIAQKGLHAAQAGLAQARAQIQYAEITAPISGVVVGKYKDSGDMASPGAPILAIEDPSKIILRTYVKEQQVNRIHVGDTVMVSVQALNKNIQGHITQIVPSGDPTTHSYLVKASLGKDPELKVGMFANVQFATGKTQGIMIPHSAIVMRSDIPGVYMVESDNSVHFRMIRTGRVWGDRTEVLSGLSVGEHIVVSASTPLHTGEHIIPSPSQTR
jgi:RND family efflux transporter MFP subunit